MSHDNAIDDGDRYMARFIRASISKFANSIDRQKCVNDKCGDELFWKAFSLMMLGKYSFHCIDCDLLACKQNVAIVKIFKGCRWHRYAQRSEGSVWSQLSRKITSLSKLQRYLSRFVIKPLEDGIKILDSFVYQSNKYVLQFEFMQEIYIILRFCSCILGDRKKFNLYKQLSHLQIAHVKSQVNSNNSLIARMADIDFEKKVLDATEVFNQMPHIYDLNQSFINTVAIFIYLINITWNAVKFQRITENVDQINCNRNRESRLQHLDQQFFQWKITIVDEKTRDNELFQAWKNSTCVKFCNYCKKCSTRLKKCKQCKQVYYCCKECQKRDWKFGQHRSNVNMY